MINLQLEVKEVESILKHLSGGLFAEVADIIAKIRMQAIPQVQQPAEPENDAPVVEPSQH